MGNGNDTIFFDGGGRTDSLLDLGNGSNNIVLRGGFIEKEYVNLGSGNSKIYLSSAKNQSTLTLDKSLHKIVLTDGLTFDDLIFTDEGGLGFLVINLKPRKTNEIHAVPLLKIEKNKGGFNSLSDLDDCSLFESANIIDKKYGTYYPTTKYPKRKIIQNFSAFKPIIYKANQYGPSNYYPDFLTPSTTYNMMELFNQTISSIYFPSTISTIPETPTIIDNDYIPLYQMAYPTDSDDYIGHNFPQADTTNFQKYLSLEFDNRIFVNQSRGSFGCSHYLNNPARFLYKAHPYNHCNLLISSFDALSSHQLNIYIDMNGKEIGEIAKFSSNVYAHIFLSREGTQAKFTLHPFSFKFYLGDNVKLNDLKFIEDADNVYVQISDDSNTDINIAIIKKLNGITLQLLIDNKENYFFEDPEIIDEPGKLPVVAPT